MPQCAQPVTRTVFTALADDEVHLVCKVVADKIPAAALEDIGIARRVQPHAFDARIHRQLAVDGQLIADENETVAFQKRRLEADIPPSGGLFAGFDLVGVIAVERRFPNVDLRAAVKGEKGFQSAAVVIMRVRQKSDVDGAQVDAEERGVLRERIGSARIE